MEDPPRPSTAYTTRLDQTLQDLQARVKEQEALLSELRSSTNIRTASSPLISGPSSIARTHLSQLLTLTVAYKDLLTTTPYTPLSKSPLPALLAHRTLTTSIRETQGCTTTISHDLTILTSALASTRTTKTQSLALQTALESRIQTLTTAQSKHTTQTPAQLLRTLRTSLLTKTQDYESRTSTLLRSFHTFLTQTLAPLLAAEELGGPIVGQDLDITPAQLIAGFNTSGKPKPIPSSQSQTLDSRQRRIDEIWGPPPTPSSPSNPEFNSSSPFPSPSNKTPHPHSKPRTASQAALTEVRSLTEQLLQAHLEAEENGSDGYVTLSRDSAAARFLVRSKVAQYHLKDARRLKLVDFAREFI